MAAKTEPWERQQGESAKAFEAFMSYCEMGAGRSIRAVSEQLGKSEGLCERWSFRHRWVERARAYDNHMARQRTAKAREEQRAMNRRHIAIAGKLQQLALDALEETDAAKIKPHTVAAMIQIATELERNARRCEVMDGEPEDVLSMMDLQRKREEFEHRKHIEEARLEREQNSDDGADIAAAWVKVFGRRDGDADG